MSSLTLTDIQTRFNQFQHSHLCEGWAEVPNLLTFSDNQLTITLPFVSHSLQNDLVHWYQSQQDLAALRLEIRVSPKPLKTEKPPVKGVKNIIAISSGKGGVGKSTTAVNLALALTHLGAKTGLLDADIYGPSVPMMLGVEEQTPKIVNDNQMMPVIAHGIHTNSIAYLMDKSEAAIWRGPMASKALAQLLNDTYWPDLDYLIVDMPPGTGDIQLTLAQQIPTTGAVIITTPQDLALADAIKGVNMFTKSEVPILGLIENMSTHICRQCGHEEAIFGTGGAEKMAKTFSIPLLGQLPLHIDIQSNTDSGKPSVASDPSHVHSQIYIELAEQIASRLYWQGEVAIEQILFKEI